MATRRHDTPQLQPILSPLHDVHAGLALVDPASPWLWTPESDASHLCPPEQYCDAEWLKHDKRSNNLRNEIEAGHSGSHQ